MFLSVNKDITAEESDFVLASRAIVQTNAPVYYQSEQNPVSIALWHPPMYIYTLSLIMKFSQSEIAIRSLNVIFSIFTSIVIFLFCLRINKKNGKLIGLVSSALFLINYYVIVYLVYSYLETKKKVYLVLGSFLFLCSLGNRYPIAILVFLGILVYLLFNKNLRAFASNYFLSGLFGGLAFLIIWAYYSIFIEPGSFFSFITHNAALGAQQFSNLSLYFSSFLLNLSQITRLFTLPVVILFFVSIIHFFKRKETYLRILLIYTLTIFLFFIVVPRPAFGYPRYFLTIMPGLFILISLCIYENLSRNAKAIRLKDILFAGIIFFSCLALLIYLNPQGTFYRNDGLIKATNLPDLAYNLLSISPVFLGLIFNKKSRKIVLILFLLAALLAFSFYFDLKFSMNDSKIKEVGEYLKNNTAPSDIIIAPKAVAYYAERKVYANDFNKPPLDKISVQFIKDYIIMSYRDRKMESRFFLGEDVYAGLYYVNYTSTDENVFKAKYMVLNYKIDNLLLEKKTGDYYIYRMQN
jgi:hypothetical protein